MEMLFLIIGLIGGFGVAKLFKRSEKTFGIIDVDTNTGMCRVRITSEELGDPNKKHAIFIINHDASISRDEQ